MKLLLTNIESSIINEFRYNFETSEMIITFAGDTSYSYKGVNEIVVSEFIDAESKGKYINSIKKEYDCEKIVETLTQE